jgi:stage II sporulation protein D
VTVESPLTVSGPSATRATRLGLAVAIGGLVAILATVVTPERLPAIEPPPAFVFPSEPEIRVRVASLDAGQSLSIAGVEHPSAGERGRTVVVKSEAGSARLDGAAVSTPVALTPARDSHLAIGDRRYAGDIVVVAEPEAGRVHLVNRLGIERYLEGVVLSEMPPDSADEALLAQAVASRSYAVHQLIVRRSRTWDVTDSQRSQVYRGTPLHVRLARRIVEQTRGRVLVHDGRVIEALFSSTCGGNTRDATEAFGDESAAPLRGAGCGFCEGTQFSTWSAKVRRSDAGRALELGAPIGEVDAADVHASGRLGSIIVRGGGREKRLTGNQFKELFGAAGRSTWFTRITIDGDYLVCDGRGYGHGVGMCQVGAQRLAAARRDHASILAHYYPGATLGLLYPLDGS